MKIKNSKDRVTVKSKNKNKNIGKCPYAHKTGKNFLAKTRTGQNKRLIKQTTSKFLKLARKRYHKPSEKMSYKQK